MNELAAEGWEYQRAETLPSIERAGLTGSTTEWRNVLVFRRLSEDAAEVDAPELLPPPVVAPVVAAVAAPAVAETPAETADDIAKEALHSYEEAALSAADEAPDEPPVAHAEPREETPRETTLTALRSISKTDT
jgi:hypothetical protein